MFTNFLLLWNTIQRSRSHTRAYAHPYTRTHIHPTPLSTSERLSRRGGSWDWRSHHGHLAINGNVASHWRIIRQIWETPVSNLGFELWIFMGLKNIHEVQTRCSRVRKKYINGLKNVHWIRKCSWLKKSISQVLKNVYLFEKMYAHELKKCSLFQETFTSLILNIYFLQGKNIFSIIKPSYTKYETWYQIWVLLKIDST